MSKLPDYSEWLNVGERLEVEEGAWLEAGFHKTYATAIDKALGRSLAPIVLELGCGIGLVPYELTVGRKRPVVYYGVDANEQCLDCASFRNSDKKFVKADIRKVVGSKDLEEDFELPNPYVVCSFAVLKHFDVQESVSLIKHILKMAPVVIFSIPVADKAVNDGTEFNHSWLTWNILRSLVVEADKVIERITDLDGASTVGYPTGIEVVLTCKGCGL